MLWRREEFERLVSKTTTTSLDTIDKIVVETPNETWPVMAGIISFGSSLAASTWIQLNILGVSTGTRPPMIPTTFGIATVCIASLMSHHTAIQTYTCVENYRRKRRICPSNSNSDNNLHKLMDQYRQNIKNNFPLSLLSSSAEWENEGITSRYYKRDSQFINVGGLFQVSAHHVRICVVGLLTFKLLGGRFWAISPSSYTHLGSFARSSIPARERYATPTQKRILQRLGRRYGCHTCGIIKQRGRGLGLPGRGGIRHQQLFVGDHMPPKSVAAQYNQRWYNRLLNRRLSYRFYPQCTNCSNKQGSLLSKAIITNSNNNSRNNLAKAGGGKSSYYHGLKFRWNHCTGGVVAGITTVGVGSSAGGAITMNNSEQQEQIIQRGNPERYQYLQDQAEKLGRRMINQIRTTFGC